MCVHNIYLFSEQIAPIRTGPICIIIKERDIGLFPISSRLKSLNDLWNPLFGHADINTLTPTQFTLRATKQSHTCVGSVLWPNDCLHEDVMKWRPFPRYWPFVRGIHRSPVNSPHKGQWRGAFMFSLICVWINGWVNNREVGDLRRYRAHYDLIVMAWFQQTWKSK